MDPRVLGELAADGRTVLVSSHLMSEMAQTADHLVIIGRGRLLADVSTQELIESSARRDVLVRSPRAAELAELIAQRGGTVARHDDGALVVTGLDLTRESTDYRGGTRWARRLSPSGRWTCWDRSGPRSVRSVRLSGPCWSRWSPRSRSAPWSPSRSRTRPATARPRPAALTLAVGEAVAFASFGLDQAILASHGQGVSLGHPGVPGAVLSAGLLLCVCALLGLALGAIIRHTAGGIAATIAVILVPGIAALLPAPWNGRIGRFTLLEAAQQVSALHPAADLFSPGWSLLVLLAWPAAGLAAAALLITRRDA